ncbi:SCO family protein [Actinoallomurus iriomotensis]|uniref:SCO family protein n=1 Tax=Actinoallomurus iriomotensis TaxID=478107 RepID=A0A9W6S9L0_9ACTN|nr:SCO family protein [Actinoallomurus iriomotensis]GLY88225.1 SCO family protein [Actinoallomurus iriomotensis]
MVAVRPFTMLRITMFFSHATGRGARVAGPGAAIARRLAGAAALGLLTTLAACGNQADSPPVRVAGPTPDLHGTRITTPLREPDLTLTGASGRPVNLRKATEGRLTLVYFGYTHCPDVCPTTMADLAAALRKLAPAQRTRIAVVFITTDPWRDTPKVIKSWLASFDSSFIGLTGDYAKIQAAAKPLGIALERPSSTTGDYEVTHGAEVLPFGTDHRAHLIYTAGVTAADWAADLPKLLRETTTKGGDT